VPLAPVYRRLASLCPTLRLDIAPPGSSPGRGWTDGAALAAEPRLLDSWLAGEASRIRGAYGIAARHDVVASRALHRHLWSVSLLMSGPWYLQRRVPRVRPGDVRVHLGTGALRLVPAPFACLPSDPAAALPGVRVLPDEEALRADLRTAVADHVAPLLTAIAPRLRRGARALWGMAGDDLLSGIWHLGRALGQEEHAVRLGGELLPGPLPPFPGGADFRRLTDADGLGRPTRTRLGCCLLYTLRAADTCGTCPRRHGRQPELTAAAG
jgi:FhuF 2Fe-2S C-terminal domain